MLDFYVIYRLGHLPKDSKLANSPIDKKTNNVDKPVKCFEKNCLKVGLVK